MYKQNFGQFPDKTIEWVLLNEPCYHAWIVRENVHSAQFRGPALERFNLVTKRAQALKLTTYCQTCQTNLATGVAFTQDDKNRVKSVFFHCARCAKEEGILLLKPSLLLWPLLYTRDRFGSQKVRTALLSACGVPMLNDASNSEMEEFFSNPDNFTLPVELAAAA